MKKPVFLSLFLLAVYAVAVPSKEQSAVNQQVFDAVIQEAAKFHYDGTFRQKYAILINEYRQKSLKSVNNDELAKVINSFFRQIPDSHFGINAPSRHGNNIRSLESGIKLIESGGNVYVYYHKYPRDPIAAAKFLKSGDRIISVNGNEPDRNARYGLATQIYREIDFGPIDGKTVIKFSRNGKINTCTYSNVQLKNMPKISRIGLGVMREFYYSQLIGKDVGYIKFDAFTPKSIISLRHDIADKFKNCKKLIIDLRENSGGIISLGVNCASFLAPKRVHFGEMVISEQKIVNRSYPQEDRFKGKVYILTGKNSYSTAEIFALAMQEAGCAVLLGEKTGGLCLPSLFIELPHKFRFQTVVGNYHSSKGVRIEGKGVSPDVEIKITSEQLRKGYDPFIQYVIKN